MFAKILVPLDGSALSSTILDLVRRPANGGGGKREVLLLHVLDVDVRGYGDDPYWQGTPPEVRNHLGLMREIVASEGADCRLEVRAGDPAEVILQYARELRPDIVAMSTHGRSGLSRVLRGSVAESVLRRSPFPLLLATPAKIEGPGADREPGFRRILVPLDRSEAGRRVLPLAEEVARAFGAVVVLAHVEPVPAEPVLYGAIVKAMDRASADLRLDVARLEKAGIRARLRVAFGDPAAEILLLARAEKADLLALATHGRTGLARAVFGSVAEAVLREAPVPLLVVRTAETPEPARSAASVAEATP
ncbi:MAG: universal stress protein [Planctomycetales bacterium]|nr:universal stress protein [Planctomycetales bacterium]